MHDDEWFTLEELNERLGPLVWVEQQMAAILRRWSGIEPLPAAAVMFATAGAHHAWHGEVIESCLPTSPQLQPEQVVRAPTSGWEDAAQRLNELIDPAATAARVRSLVKVIDPWLERETTALHELARPVSDAAMQRWLRFVMIDHDDGRHLAQDLLTTMAGDAVRVGDHLLVSELDITR